MSNGDARNREVMLRPKMVCFESKNVNAKSPQEMFRFDSEVEVFLDIEAEDEVGFEVKQVRLVIRTTFASRNCLTLWRKATQKQLQGLERIQL